MNKTETQKNGRHQASESTAQQSDEEYYNSLLHRITMAQVACQLISEDMKDTYKELKAYHKKHMEGGMK